MILTNRVYGKGRYRQNIVIECGNEELTKGEMDNLLFMNEPITSRQIGSLFKILPSKFTTVFAGEKYILDCLGLFLGRGKKQK